MKLMKSTIAAAALVLASNSVEAVKMSAKMSTSSTMVSPFAGMNLDGIEASLLAMAKEDASPSLKPFVTQITELTKSMKQAVDDQATRSQSNLKSSLDQWKGCELKNEEIENNLTEFSQKHLECSGEESNAYAQWQSCLTRCTTPCDEANLKCDEFNKTDVWPEDGRCKMQDSAVYADTKEWMTILMNSYENLYKAWTSSKEGCEQGKIKCDACYSGCGQYEKVYKDKVGVCSTYQAELETKGCDRDTTDCVTYHHCYASKEQAYHSTAGAVKQQEKAYIAEYRGLLRINCLLEGFAKAFGAEKMDPKALSASIETCKNTDFSAEDRVKHLRIEYYNVTAEIELKKCDGPNNVTDDTNLIPGSPAWIHRFYKDMPANTFYEACDACCCFNMTGGPTC
eukprot:TRINITY_DN2314_c2_g1_i3.p1 TRINITY_DN2314_c2_g1~~TRINITY_DN2314_c2_g1_i3.p1  ORF type:complete len:397 (+),score=100.65 TRINITY_DN2314_c2_g1_i3:95-1285(+)